MSNINGIEEFSTSGVPANENKAGADILAFSSGKIFRDTAPRYWAKGLSVIPLKRCDKRPILNDWQQWHDKLPDTEDQDLWCKVYDTNNIGLVLGKQSGVVIIDIDTPDETLESAIVEALPPSPWVRRGAKGCAIAYKFNGVGTFRIKNDAGETIVEHLSSRTQVVLPPSIHPKTQRPYTATADLAEVIDRLAPLPGGVEATLRKVLRAHGCTVDEKGAGNERLPDLRPDTVIPQSGRNSTLTRYAGRFRGQGHTEDEILDLLRGINERHCRPLLDDAEVQDIAHSVMRYAENFPLQPTQLEMAEMLHATHGDRLAWIGRENWLKFDGQTWVDGSPQGEIEELVRGCQLRFGEFLRAKHPERDAEAEVRKLKKSLETASFFNGTTKLAQTRFQTPVGDFDANGWVLNTPNGVLDLTNGVLRSPQAADKCRKMTPVGYAAGAECPQFLAFLDWAGNGIEGWRDYMQQLLGLALTGDPQKQVFAVFSGTGGNGKTTVADILFRLLGDYACSVDQRMFIHGGAESSTNDFGRVSGARVMIATESEAGARLSEATVKTATGGDKITANPKYQLQYDVILGGLPLLLTNHLPFFDGADEGLKRRLHLVPFGAKREASMQEKGLADRLVREEGPAILRWLVEGVMKYLEGGRRLVRPPAIQDFCDRYIEGQDPVGSFLKERVGPGGGIERAALHRAYAGWCSAQRGIQAMKQMRFNQIVEAKLGVKPSKKHGTYTWPGVALLT